MIKNTICSAAIEAIKSAGKPLTVKELFDFINSNNLYQFKAKEPLNILKSTLRKHTFGVVTKEKKGTSYFVINSEGKYQLK